MSDAQTLQTAAATSARKPGGPPVGVVRGFAADEGWLFVAGGITLAGGAYPVLVAAGFVFVGLSVSVFSILAQPILSAGFNGVLLIAVLAYGLFVAAALASVGLIWAGFFTVVIVPLFYLFARSLELRANIVWLGAICGGLVGFLAVLPLWMNSPFFHEPGRGFVLATLVGPGLTTVLGQLGGAWGGWRAWRDRQPPVEPEPVAGGAPAPLMRFQIRHLLWITFWVALMLTAIRLSGFAFEMILPVFVAWLVYQAATLYVGGRLVRRFGPSWFPRRTRRST